MSTTMPKRIQRKRTKGWKMPPNTVYVGRPTRWGNPFRVHVAGTVVECLDLYQGEWLKYFEKEPEARDRLRKALGGKDLVCWCPLDRPCHADVLLDLANPKSR